MSCACYNHATNLLNVFGEVANVKLKSAWAINIFHQLLSWLFRLHLLFSICMEFVQEFLTNA